jgi:DNA-binding NtrC family response regulator
MSAEGERIRVLIADDEKNFRNLLTRELERRGHQVAQAENGRRALDLLREQPADVILLDLNMPELGGIEFLRALQERPDLPEVIVLTGYATVPTALEAMRLGAYDYLTKPCKIEKLDLLVRKAAEKRRMAADNTRLKEVLARERGEAQILTASDKMLEVVKLVGRVAPTDATVLILGESGTGKELVARALHDGSPRRAAPFLPVHCGALQRELLESELFGHERGAFTGAHAQKPGLFELANGGTLLLDEIGEMDLDSQVKLLRVLETSMFYRVGGTRPLAVDVRVVAATNQDLAAKVREGRFRQDLLHRVNTVAITLPPLRERPEDIPLLADHFLGEHGPPRGPLGFSEEARRLLLAYPWPGNVRELLHVVQRAAILAPGAQIEAEDLPEDLRAYAEAPPQEGGEPRSLEGIERLHIIKVLRDVGGHRGRAAQILGIDPKTLYRKILAYQIKPGAIEEAPGGR